MAPQSIKPDRVPWPRDGTVAESDGERRASPPEIRGSAIPSPQRPSALGCTPFTRTFCALPASTSPKEQEPRVIQDHLGHRDPKRAVHYARAAGTALKTCAAEEAPPRLSRIHETCYAAAPMIGRALASVAVLLALSGSACAAYEDGRCRNYPRDPAVTRAFTLAVPCPSTGETGHRCPGFIRDHFIPLCAGGADAAGNMWWEEAARAAEKDKHELQLCHRLRVIERHGDDPALRQRAMSLYLRDVEAMGNDEAVAAAQRAF